VAASVVAFVFDQIGWIDLAVMLLHVALLAVLIAAIRADRRTRHVGVTEDG
jgi:cytochrome c biogenesis factor